MINLIFAWLAGIATAVTICEFYKYFRRKSEEPCYKLYTRCGDKVTYKLHAKRIFKYSYRFAGDPAVFEIFELEESKKYFIYREELGTGMCWKGISEDELEAAVANTVDFVYVERRRDLIKELFRAGIWKYSTEEELK